MAAQVEPKVKTASFGAAVAGIADWALAKWLFPHLADPTAQALILAAIPSVLAFAAGWLKRSQPRPVPAPVAAPSNVTVTPPKT